MGPVVEQLLAADGLNHLIRLPRGCGEQTLIRLGPLVYVAKYLRASGQTGDREQNIHNKIRSGNKACKIIQMWSAFDVIRPSYPHADRSQAHVPLYSQP